LHPVPRSLLEDSKWRARRRGLAATVVDWATERELPMRQRLAHWLARVRPAAQRLGFATRLAHAMEAALAEGSSADQQRGWWRDSGGSFAAVIDALVAQTAQPLSPALERAHG
jgi:carboxylate-amine ligase